MWTADLPDSGCGPGNAGVAAGGMVFRGTDVFQRPGSRSVFDSGTHRSFRHISPSGARILFFSLSTCGFAGSDAAPAADGPGGSSIAKGRLSAHPCGKVAVLPRKATALRQATLLSSRAEKL